MRTLYLHIGSEKTGSTSIQASLSKNAKKISSQGLCFPTLNNRYLAFLPLPFGYSENFTSKPEIVEGFACENGLDLACPHQGCQVNKEGNK